MQLINCATPLQQLSSEFLQDHGVRILVKREDLNHRLIMGNKWHKLKYNLELAKKEQVHYLVTYGGAYSNHILATAAAANEFGLRSIGIIRGDELTEHSNPTLARANELGMQLHFVERTEFTRLKNELKAPFDLGKKAYFLPEGGTNSLAIQGCSEILQDSELENCDLVAVPVGTGGTFAGVLSSMAGKKMLYGFSALKGGWIGDEINKLLSTYAIHQSNYVLFDDSNFGGYGKFDPRLIQFILDFEQQYGLILDPVYTGKMFFSVWDMIKNAQIAYGSTFLIIHTGGLQGIAGFNARHNTQLPTG